MKRKTDSKKIEQKSKLSKGKTTHRISDTGVKIKTDELKGKSIAFAVCGGIGSVESVKIIREIRRRGAAVSAFMTPSALRFITELSLEWATERKTVVNEGAQAEHLEAFDLVVIAPATLNTISKAALGIADNAVSLLIATHLGVGALMAFVPTMNAKMRNHPLYDEHRKRLEEWGAVFFEREEEEERVKMPEPIAFADWVVSLVRK